ncbi:DciA family protein [Fulvimarina sp. 2208YS6-2-32]|uniref:DciA family protein n=1 Tax=Fulvimarina uroteuthidis TaxID=3098149 RepID=A0ABU5I3T5_9HYPH|nr:DciA family protein [Fulvimarina sp. 2208YS6-2-32]MDY8109433.1 DciA family protein [Fulvimarina sp. 2208YS6-2-32]
MNPYLRPVRRPPVRSLSDIAARLVDPVLQKKAGMTAELAVAWPQIAGPRLAGQTRPLEFRWPPKRSEDDPFQPATLVVGAEPMAALRLQHQTSELIARINRLYGFPAIAKIKITQMPIMEPQRNNKPPLRALTAADRRKVEEMVGHIEDETLKASLKGLAEAMLSRGDRSRD